MQLLSVRFDFHSSKAEARSLVRRYVRSTGKQHRVCTYTQQPTWLHVPEDLNLHLLTGFYIGKVVTKVVKL